jgi:uncharacterized repeat protein (TIGR03833 family)
VTGTKSGKDRANLYIGCPVNVVLKKDQQTGAITRGHVREILTNSAHHPRGIKVRLMENGLVGRVKTIAE